MSVTSIAMATLQADITPKKEASWPLLADPSLMRPALDGQELTVC